MHGCDLRKKVAVVDDNYDFVFDHFSKMETFSSSIRNFRWLEVDVGTIDVFR